MRDRQRQSWRSCTVPNIWLSQCSQDHWSPRYELSLYESMSCRTNIWRPTPCTISIQVVVLELPSFNILYMHFALMRNSQLMTGVHSIVLMGPWPFLTHEHTDVYSEPPHKHMGLVSGDPSYSIRCLVSQHQQAEMQRGQALHGGGANVTHAAPKQMLHACTIEYNRCKKGSH